MDKETPGPGSQASPVNSAKRKEESIPIVCELFQKMVERILPDSFYEANIILISKPDKDNVRKLYTNVPHEPLCEISFKKLANHSTMCKMIIHYDQVRFISGM